MTSENGVNEIKSKIIKTEPVYWEKLKYIQNENFKELSKEAYKKLKQSMLNNDYVMPFAVWQDKDSIYVIDGVHRCRVLGELKKEGYLIPATFPANFLDCKNRKEAAKLVLVYSSAYAKTTDEGLYEFLNLEDMNFDELKLEIDIPDIDLDKFEQGYLKDTDSEKLDEVPEVQKEAVSRLGDLFVIDGKHRVLCGDSTKPEDINTLFGGAKIDLVFTSPPYNQGNSKGDLFSHGKRNDNLYKHGEDNRTKQEYFNFIISILERCSENVSNNHSVVLNIAYNAKSRDDYGKILFSDANPFTVKETIVWNKGGSINLPQVGIYSRKCEFVFVMSQGPNYLTSQKYGESRWNYWETKKQNQPEDHKATFPVELAAKAVTEFSFESNNVFEPFFGYGTTLIASEQLGRNCYGMEIVPNYMDAALRRYKTLYPNADIKCNREDFNFEKLWQDQEKK